MTTRAQDAMARLLAIMEKLRDPDGGCPWDREQTFATIAPYTIEEAYEVADAIARGDREELRDELGDLLFQVVFHARMAEEEGTFGFAEVADAIADKMERRHPHVFGATTVSNAAAQTQAWEAIKAAERAHKQPAGSILAGIPTALPALTRAEKLGKRAGRVGFDWSKSDEVLDKVREEIAEVEQAVAAAEPAERVAHEIGDVLFAVAQYARHLGVDPEEALRRANRRFETRFRALEQMLAADGRNPQDATMPELEGLWQRAKSLETK